MHSQMRSDSPETFAEKLPSKRILAIKLLLVSCVLLLMLLPLVAVFFFIVPLQDLNWVPSRIVISLISVTLIYGLVNLRSGHCRATRNVEEFFLNRNPRELVESEMASAQPGDLTLFLTNEYLRKQTAALISLLLANSILVTSLLVIPSATSVVVSCLFIGSTFFLIPTYGRHKRWMQKCLVKNKASFEQEIQLK